jgi:uncharacterized protein (TIGR03067 family)
MAFPAMTHTSHFLQEIPMLRQSIVAFTLMLTFSLAGRSGDGKEDDGNQGTWIPTKAELGGKAFPDEVTKTIKLEIKDDKYTVTVGKQVDKGTVKLNKTAKPKELDIAGTEGPNKGKTILGIYERDGDTLRVCYDLGGKNRPTEFKTTEGTQQLLITYKKEKP